MPSQGREASICQFWHWLCAISFCFMCAWLRQSIHTHTHKQVAPKCAHTHAQVGRRSRLRVQFFGKTFVWYRILDKALNYLWWLILGKPEKQTLFYFPFKQRLPREIWIFRLRDLLSSMINVFLFYFCHSFVVCAHFHSTDLPDNGYLYIYIYTHICMWGI